MSSEQHEEGLVANHKNPNTTSNQVEPDTTNNTKMMNEGEEVDISTIATNNVTETKPFENHPSSMIPEMEEGEVPMDKTLGEDPGEHGSSVKSLKDSNTTTVNKNISILSPFPTLCVWSGSETVFCSSIYPSGGICSALYSSSHLGKNFMSSSLLLTGSSLFLCV